jgi:hypothetical protein
MCSKSTWEANSHSASQDIPRLSWILDPATGTYPEPAESSPHPPILFL